MINVTETYLPPPQEYSKYLEQIWESGWITNNGPLLRRLEDELKSFLGVKHLFIVNNGTTALQLAIKALNLRGEIITTPFSYVATTSSIVWEGCEPRFVDIDPNTLTIDPALIADAISPATTGILATHVYGHPASVETIDLIAKQYKLKVIYDAAHAFGVTYKGHSLLSFGEISTLSFHATKLFHTVEGGAVVTNDDELAHKLYYMRNFGHDGQENFWGVGINGKASELHAAMGLCVLPHIPELVEARAAASKTYDGWLRCSPLTLPRPSKFTSANFSYYPVIFPSEQALLDAKSVLEQSDIFPRRYFYPSLNFLPYVNPSKMPVAEGISKRILCLPLSHAITKEQIAHICSLVNGVL